LLSFFEGTITTLPLTLIFILSFTILKRKRDSSIFLVAFLSGLLLDMVTLRTLGMTSIFFLSLSFLVLLYERKYEIATIPFVMAATFIGSVAYLWIFVKVSIFMQSIVASIIAVSLLIGIILLRKREVRKKY
jgi:cell shape-determining protein MreD